MANEPKTIKGNKCYEVELDDDLSLDKEGNPYWTVSIFDPKFDTQMLVYDMSQADALMLGAILDRSKLTLC